MPVLIADIDVGLLLAIPSISLFCLT